MIPDHRPHRRALLSAYQRYMAADRACRLAQKEALSWFPTKNRPSVPPIGNQGSPLRRLHEHRDRALVRLQVLRLRLHETRQRATPHVSILALPHKR